MFRLIPLTNLISSISQIYLLRGTSLRPSQPDQLIFTNVTGISFTQLIAAETAFYQMTYFTNQQLTSCIIWSLNLFCTWLSEPIKVLFPCTLTNKLSGSSEITEVFCFFPLSLITLSRSFGLLPLQTVV
jgi:hypothetical protein